MLLQIIITGILLGGIYAVISIGLSLIFGVMRVINFAHGEFLMLGMYGSFWAFQLFDIHPYISIFIVAPFSFLIGVLIYKALVHPAMKRGTIVVVLGTVGLSVVLQNLALFLWKSDFRTIDISIATSHIKLGSVFIPLASLVAFLTATIVTIILWMFLTKTHMGRAIRSTAQDKPTSMLMGINVEKTFLVTFGLGSALVAVGATLISPIFAVFPSIGVNMVLICFVIVVLGGLGSIPGAWLGGIIIGLIDALAGFYFSSEIKQIIFFLLFIGIMIFKPAGLLGVKGSEEVGLKA
jgi:branched-chain amino acid transport system permease protein